MTDGLPILSITDPAIWEVWLKEHHANKTGAWLKIAKKNSGLPSVTHDQVLEVALCYGWIDGQRNGLDENYFLQKFTPRRPRSLWSKRNIEKVESLMAAGRMQPLGLAEVEKAKADGRWQAAYDSAKNMEMPADFLQALEQHPKAKIFFETLNKTNTYAIALGLHTAKKAETRQRRLEKFITMLERGERIY